MHTSLFFVGLSFSFLLSLLFFSSFLSSPFFLLLSFFFFPSFLFYKKKNTSLRSVFLFFQSRKYGCRQRLFNFNFLPLSHDPAETIAVLKVTTLFLLRISLQPNSYGKVDETTATSLKTKSRRAN